MFLVWIWIISIVFFLIILEVESIVEIIIWDIISLPSISWQRIHTRRVVWEDNYNIRCYKLEFATIVFTGNCSPVFDIFKEAVRHTICIEAPRYIKDKYIHKRQVPLWQCMEQWFWFFVNCRSINTSTTIKIFKIGAYLESGALECNFTDYIECYIMEFYGHADSNLRW